MGMKPGMRYWYILSYLLASYMEQKGRVCLNWGGEEFLLVFEAVNGEEALQELEKVRTLVSQQQIGYKGTEHFRDHDIRAGRVQQPSSH